MNLARVEQFAKISKDDSYKVSLFTEDLPKERW